MALVTHFCGVCGRRVPPDDLEAGDAAILDHVTYCRDCAATAGIDEPRKPIAVDVIPVQARRSKATAGPSRRPVMRARPRRRSGAGAGIIAGGVLALLAVAVVVVATMLDREETPSNSDAVSAPGGPLATTNPPTGATRDAAERVAREQVREKARVALARMQDGIPGSDAGLVDLLDAKKRLAREVRELRLIAASSPTDRALDAFVSRGERLGEETSTRIESEGERIFRNRMEAVNAFLGTDNFDRATKALADLPQGFDQTSWADRLRDESKKVETAKLAYVRAEARRRDEGWTYLFTAASLEGWTGQGNADLQLAEDDEIGYRYLAVHNPGPDEARLLFTAPGGDEWRNFKVRLDLRSVEGDLLIYVGKPGTSNGVFKIRVASKSVPKTDGWWTLQVEAEGTMVRLRAGARLMGTVPNPSGSTGKIGFGVKARSRVEIRNVRVKVAR
jgi:hypothetical protein